MPRKRKIKSFSLSLLVLVFVFALRHWSQTHNQVQPTPSVVTPIAHENKDSSPPPTPRAPSSSLTLDESIYTTSRIHDFDAAKTQLRKLFARGREFYCNCSYDFSRKPNVDPTSCGLVSRSPRAKRIEWEHVVPASLYGRQFEAWRRGNPSCTGREKKGRECARKASPDFRQIESDMYNLVPAVGELNRARGDSQYGEVPGEPREYGACDFETLAKTTEPRPEIRGDIARIYFYMDARYPQFHIVNTMNQPLLEEWARVDPIDQAELQRLHKIEGIQGNSFFIGRLGALAPRAGVRTQ